MKKLSTGIRLTLAGAAATAMFASVVAPAYAATNTTVEKVGSTLTVIGAFSTANSIVVSPDTGIIRVKDNNANVSALAGCVTQGLHEVKCSTAGISQIRVSTGARDDVVTLKTGLFTTVLGGDGNDTLQNLGSGQARLNGNDGDDRLFGGIVDSLFGQNNNDFLQGGQLLRGGPGDDTLQGLDGNDSMFGDEGFDNLDGGAGFDDLCATAEIKVNCEA